MRSIPNENEGFRSNPNAYEGVRLIPNENEGFRSNPNAYEGVRLISNENEGFRSILRIITHPSLRRTTLRVCTKQSPEKDHR